MSNDNPDFLWLLTFGGKKLVLKSAILSRKHLVFGFQNHPKHSSPVCLVCGCNVSLSGLTAEAFNGIEL